MVTWRKLNRNATMRKSINLNLCKIQSLINNQLMKNLSQNWQKHRRARGKSLKRKQSASWRSICLYSSKMPKPMFKSLKRSSWLRAWLKGLSQNLMQKRIFHSISLNIMRSFFGSILIYQKTLIWKVSEMESFYKFWSRSKVEVNPTLLLGTSKKLYTTHQKNVG